MEMDKRGMAGNTMLKLGKMIYILKVESLKRETCIIN